MSDGTIQDRLNAVRELMQMFRAERVVYLIAAVLSLGAIFYFGLQILRTNAADPSTLVAIGGSGGVIGFGMSRLLVMWTQAMRLVAGQNIGD